MKELIRKILKENISEAKRFSSYEMNDESFARVFQFFLDELKNNTGLSKAKMRKSLILTIRMWTEKPSNLISKKVIDHFIENYPNLNPFKVSFRPRNKYGINVIFEHTTPVNIFVTQLFEANSLDEIKLAMSEYSGLSIITTEEDRCLHSKGYSKIRPQGWRQSYSECGIDIMDENQYNQYKEEKFSNPDTL